MEPFPRLCGASGTVDAVDHHRVLVWAFAPSKLDRVESTLSSSPDKPLARDDAGVMTNDPRGCDGSKSSRKGSRGAIGSYLIHSTSPFESPRNRPEVGSSHVPRPCTCGPQSH